MADSSIIYLDPDLVRFWRFDFDILHGQGFPSFPSDRGLEICEHWMALVFAIPYFTRNGLSGEVSL